MRLIGITGSIACGKSTVSRELFRRGFPVIDGDILARELTVSGGRAIDEIRAVFGDHYISEDGSLNRREMGRLIFSDAAARSRLDQLMAPHLLNLTLEKIDQARSSGTKLCFLDMPLLLEKGYDRYCDAVWCVWLPEEVQLERLMARDGFTRQEALSRMHAVMSSDEKADLSSFVIDNSGSVENTIRQLSEQLETELRRTENAPRRRRSAEAGSVPSSSASSVFPPSPPPSEGIERSDASRRMPSHRKAEWLMPRWLSVLLVSFCVVLVSAFTAQFLMNAYLTRRQEIHLAEQRAIDERYPLHYADIIRDTALEYKLAPALVAAVILNESSFNHKAVSSVGAYGLMQLMPDTAEWIAHKLRISDYRFDMMDDPETNIRFGCWYLNYLSGLFNADPYCVVCAYHAGQGEVSSWLANPLYSSDHKTLIRNNLPEGPTKQYAGRVTRDYGIYQAKYYDQVPSAVDPADIPYAD